MEAAYLLRHDDAGSLEVSVLPFGATITSVRAPDRRGNLGEVSLGFDDEAPYTSGKSPYFGCVAGRVANRTARGRFALDGETYELEANNGAHHLHGGLEGFDKKWWAVVEHSQTSLTLVLRSSAGDGGYPGCLDCRVTYSLPTPRRLRMEYAATASQATPVNLTNHTYWNLEDGGASDVKGHVIRLAASMYTPVDDDSIPTGEIRRCRGAMDLSAPAAVGARLSEADQGMGYDHNFVLREPRAADGLRPVATVFAPKSGRVMTVRSSEPGVQFYTGNYLDGTLSRRAGSAAFGRHHGFCLETQHFPDSVHHEHFPPTILRPGAAYAHATEHEFSTCGTDTEAFAAKAPGWLERVSSLGLL